jgi:hypothetical protein
MRAFTRAATAIALLAIVGNDQAHAQTATRNGRVAISVNAGVQPSPISFDSSTTQPVYLETSVLDTAYDIRNGLLVDGGVRYRIARGFGVGVAISWFSTKNDATVTAALPHPFFFRTPRSIEGTAAGLQREEIVTHLQATYAFRPTTRLEVTFAGGPSFFRARQAFVENVSYTDSYPYDAPAFTAASSTRIRGDRTGFNAGADVAMRLSGHAGVGGLVRFSRARIPFVLPNGGPTVTSDAGGVQVAGGVRLYF